MNEHNKYFEEDIPSNRLDIFSKIKNSNIVKLVRYSSSSPKKAMERYKIPDSSLFCLTSGPLLVTLESGLTIGFASLPAKVSVTVWVEETEEGERDNGISIIEDKELFPIDSCDLAYGKKSICQLIGKRVTEVRIIKREPKNSRAASRPCEAGLVFEFDDGLELILSHGLHDASDDFAIISREDILPFFLDQIKEIPI